METRNDELQRPQTENDAPKSLKSRLERWIEKLEERIAPSCQYQSGAGFRHGYRKVGNC
jgi:hypothetical protein